MRALKKQMEDERMRVGLCRGYAVVDLDVLKKLLSLQLF